MAGTSGHRAPDGASFHGRIGPGRRWPLVAIPLLLVIAALTPTGRGVVGGLSARIAAGAPSTAPDALAHGAADQLEASTRLGGTGYTFAIVQRTAIDALAGGPLVDIPDPNDRHKSLGKTDHYEVASYVERGAASSDGFWAEVRDGPQAGEQPDFEQADYQLGAIVRDGKSWRNDGDGWYGSSVLPGIGLDPATAALLPQMLRGLTAAKSAAPVDQGGAVAGVEATTKVSDLPGIIAVDAASFTALDQPIDLSFDAQGRLVGLHAIARNTRLDGFAMHVDTTIELAYPLIAPDIPKPDPLIDPDADPRVEP